MKQILSSILATSFLLSVMTSSLASETPLETGASQVYTETLATVALSGDYAEVGTFSEGFAVVTTHDGRKGVIDNNGTVIVEPTSRYARIGEFSNGFALFDTCVDDNGYDVGDVNSTVGYLNTKGEEAISFAMNRGDYLGGIYGFQNGYGIFYQSSYGTHTYHLVDTSGNITILPDASRIYGTAVDEAGYIRYEEEQMGGSYLHGFTNLAGEIVIQAQYQGVSISGFKEGLCAVVHNGQLSYINTSGQTVFHKSYLDSVFDYYDGLAGFRDGNGLFGYMDQQGNTVIPAIYDAIYNFSEGFAWVVRDGKLCLINTDGDWITGFAYDAVGGEMINGYTVAATGYFTDYGFVGDSYLLDTSGTVIIPKGYDYISVMKDTGKVLVKSNSRFSIVDMSDYTGESQDSGAYPAWAVSFITFVEKSIMPDISTSNYDNASSRGLIASCLYNMYGNATISPAHAFIDGGGYDAAISWCFANEIMTGVNDSTFDTNSNVTRQEFALILMKLSNYLEKITNPPNVSIINQFQDGDSVDSWAKGGVAWALANQLMHGFEGDLNPRGNVTRAEVSVMLFNISQL